MARKEEIKLSLTIEEQAVLVAIDDIHKKKLSKFEAKQLITDQMRQVARKVGAPEIVFEKPEITEIELDQETKARIAKTASKFKSERKIIEQQRTKKHVCKECGNVSSSSCALCGKAWYCSKECQTRHWKNTHKSKCVGYKAKLAANPLSTPLVTQQQSGDHNTNINVLDP